MLLRTMRAKSRIIVSVMAFAALVLAGTSSLSAAGDKSYDAIDPGLKLGVIAGWPIEGVDLGIRLSKDFEFNVMGGLQYFSDVSVGLNALFTVATPKVGSQSLPISLGPEFDLGIGIGSYLGFQLSPLFVVRAEYTFEHFPLNLFVQLGAGVTIYTGGILPIGFYPTSSIGARFQF